jgi:zinc protease
VRDFSILRGARAFVREDKSQPRLAVAILFQGGRLIEDQATSGMTEIMLRTMVKSTTTRKGDLIVHEAESLGGEIKIVNEPDFFGLAIEVLSRNAEPVTRSALDIIENPYFEKGELIRERERLLADQAIARDDSAAHATELMWTSLFPGHPYGLPRLGSPAAIKGVTEEQLTAWHARTIQRQVPMVVIVGDTDGSALVSRIFSDAFKRGELDKSLKVNLPPLIAAPQLEAEARDRRVTSQAIGLRTAPSQSNDSLSLALLAQFAALRASQSSMSVAVTNETRLASGNFFAQMSTLPETETRSREVLVAEFGRIASAPPSGDDFDIARNAAIGSHAIRLEGHVDRALAYARAVLAGRQAADVDRQPDLVRAIRLAEVKRVAELVFKSTQAGVGVVRGK